MANNLPEDLKHDWVDNEIVMPADVNAWSSATNTIKDVIPLYATAGNFYTATYTSNTYNLTPITVDGKTNVPPTAYIDGMSIVFKCPTDNQANCKVKIGSLTAKSIYSLENVNLPAGKLKQGCYIELKFDSLNDCFKFQQDLNKADVGEVVDLTSNQIIEGVKEFTEIIQGTVDKSIKDSDGNDISQTYVKNTDNKFHALKGYLDNGELLTDAEGLADVVNYAHSTFDLSKFTVTGTPTITDDGIASGFSSSNYITASATTGTTFTIQKTIITGSDISGVQLFLYAYRATDTIDRLFDLRINNNEFAIVYKNSGGTNIVINSVSVTATTNTQYAIKIVVNSGKLYYYINGTLAYTVNDLYSDGISKIQTNTGEYKGSIDLKQFSISVDGIPVFSGNKTGIDTIKPDDYTVVGTPTISADGVASGFSSGNYITKAIPLNTKWKFIFKNKYATASTAQTPLSIVNSVNNNVIVRLWNRANSPNCQIVPYRDDNTFAAISFKCINNHEYEYIVWNDGTNINYQVKDLTDNSTVVEGVQSLGDYSIGSISANIFLGVNSSNSEAFTGSIDLNALKIYVDGNLVYQPCLKIPYTESKTGSKVVNAIYRDRVNDIAEQFGYANYYTLNENKANNYTVVGSPTISADGIASGFSSANYLQTTSITLGSGDFDIYASVKFTSALSNYTNGRILTQDDKIRIMPYNGTLAVAIIATDNSNIISSNFVPTINTEYLIHLYKIGTTYGAEYSSDNGSNWTNISQVTSDKQVYYYDTVKEFKLGNNIAGGDIELDLNSFKIYVDGKLAYKAIQPPCFTLPQGEIYGITEKNNREIGVPIPTFSNVLKDDEIWLEGASVLKTDYPRLYAIYGDVYEDSNNPTDSNHFRLPNCTDRVMQGINSTGTFGYIAPGLPNITGNMEVIGDHPYVGADGSFYIQNVGMGGNPIDTTPDGSSDWRISFNASRSSWIYGNSNTVQAPAIKVRVKTRYK